MRGQGNSPLVGSHVYPGQDPACGRVTVGIYRLLEPSPHRGNRWEQAVDMAILVLILLSVALVIVGTMTWVARGYGRYLRGFQLAATAAFSVEYLLRIYACTADRRYAHPVWGRLRFVVTPMAVVDLMAVLPFYLLALVAPGSHLARPLLLLRMLRLFKLFRYSRSLTVFAQVLRAKAHQLAAAFFVTGMLLVLSSSLAYFVEHPAQPKAFASIPRTMWWGITTLTPAAGDISPVTPVGQLLGSATAVIGIGLVALPSGILASGFIEAFRTEAEPSPHAADSNNNPNSHADQDAQTAQTDLGDRRCPRCGHLLRS